MKKFFIVSLASLFLVSAILLAGRTPDVSASGATVLEFNNLAGVSRPYTGSVNPLRGINGGGLPWVVRMAEGELKSNGKLEIEVFGLVIDPNDPTAIARGVAGTNPSTSFKAVVSCLSKDAAGNPTTVNVSTGLFPADAMGNSVIEETIMLPKPCIAPIVFVTSPTGAWFAATGN